MSYEAAFNAENCFHEKIQRILPILGYFWQILKFSPILLNESAPLPSLFLGQ